MGNQRQSCGQHSGGHLLPQSAADTLRCDKGEKNARIPLLRAQQLALGLSAQQLALGL